MIDILVNKPGGGSFWMPENEGRPPVCNFGALAPCEEQLLRAAYSRHGAAPLAKILGRTRHSVLNWAHRMGLKYRKAGPGRPCKRAPWDS